MKGFTLNTPESLRQRQEFIGNIILLCKHGKLEIMQQQLYKNDTVWMEPNENKDDVEFFYLVSGSLTCCRGDWIQPVRAGDSFYVSGIEEEFSIRVMEDSLLLYISTIPLFRNNEDFQTDLRARMKEIDEKDHYTAKHSRNVMNYAMLIRSRLEQLCTSAYSDMVIASRFHDIGKCRIPDEIVKKPGRLTDEEYAVMKRHATESGDILSRYYSKEICEMAASHHERLDGSGYPRGLSGEQLSFDARIIAAADAFDAMTSNRGYNRVRTAMDAAKELCALPAQYDQRVTGVLMELVESGVIHTERSESSDR